MFNISFGEVALIFIIALIVFGPKQIPQIASKVGKFFFISKNYIHKLKEDIYEQSGFYEFNKAKFDIVNSYQQLKNTLVNNDNLNLLHPPIEIEQQLYQPELDFEYQPELF